MTYGWSEDRVDRCLELEEKEQSLALQFERMRERVERVREEVRSRQQSNRPEKMEESCL